MSPSRDTNNLVGIFAVVFSGLFYMYQYVIRILPSVIQLDIVNKFAITDAIFGSFSGIYYIGYAAAHIPIGILLDKFGFRIVCTISGIVTAVSSLIIINTNMWELCIISRFITGVSSAGLSLSMLAIIAQHFRSRFGQILGLCALIGLSGGMFASPVSIAIDSKGIDYVLYSLAFIGVVMSVVFYLICKTNHTSENTSIKNNLISLIRNGKITILCLCSGFMMGLLEGFADMWGSSFFESYLGYSKNIAIFIPTLVFTGMGIGSPLLGYISDKVKNHFLICYFCGLILFLIFVPIFLGFRNHYLVSVLMIIGGIASSYQVPAIEKATSYVDPSAFSLATSYANMIFMSFGFFFHYMMGAILDSAKCYGSSLGASYALCVSLVPIFALVGAIGFLLLYLCERKTK